MAVEADSSSPDLNDRTLYRRAVEAVPTNRACMS
jgi:hypothetical protein